MDIYNFSDPAKVKQNLDRYLGPNYKLYISTKVNKKYVIKNPNGKWVHFGEIGFDDFTQHQDEKRKQQYLARATKIKGNWTDNKFSKNNLEIHLLWS